MNKKIIYGILALIVLVGAVLVVTIGLKLDMKNDANTKIYIYITPLGSAPRGGPDYYNYY